MPLLWDRDCFSRFRRRGYQPLGQNTLSSLGARHFQCFLVFCGLSVAYALRVNLSVAIVAMTDHNSTNPEFEVYDWDAKTKSLLLSSFFWGYVVTQIPGGFLAHKYGAKFTLFTGISICSLLALLTPLAAEIGDSRLVFALRVIQGLCQGVVFPSTHTFLSKWAPADERGRLVTYCYSGTQFGTVVMLAASGFIASSFLGWPSIFYLSGLAGILWSFIWLIYAASMPSDHKTISDDERKYIESGSVSQQRDNLRRTILPTPWLKIATSLPFISLLIVHCGQNWGFWTLLTEIPNYMKNVLQMDIKNNAMLSALPYLVMCLLSFLFIFISDFLNKRKWLSLSGSRKLFNSIGHWVPMVALIALGYVTADYTKLAIVLLTIAVGVNAATYLGFQVNHIDLSPNFAGTLMGITNCAANVMSILAPLTVGVIVTEETNPVQWRLVFFITAGFYLVGNTLFLLFGKTEVQPWNYPSNQRERRSSDEDALLDNNGAEIT